MASEKGKLRIDPASPSDLPFVTALLEESGLPAEEVKRHFGGFFVARRGRERVGCIGMEIYGEEVLLRSLAVARPHRCDGIGAKLLARAIGEARRVGGRRAWGLTMTGRTGLFARSGFAVVPRSSAPAALFHSLQFQGVCPESAVLIVRDL